MIAGTIAQNASQQTTNDDALEKLREEVRKINERRPGDYTVYTLVIPGTDTVQYAGMTNDLSRRLNEHSRSEKTGDLVLGDYVDHLTYTQARSMEQSLIASYSLKTVGRNSVNSIGPNNKKAAIYMQALEDLIYNEWSNERYMILEIFPGG